MTSKRASVRTERFTHSEEPRSERRRSQMSAATTSTGTVAAITGSSRRMTLRD